MPADECCDVGLRLGLPRPVGDVPVAGRERPLTYSVSEIVELLGAPSERWVVDQIRAGRFPARKIGRTWRLTQQDIAEALDACGNTSQTPANVADHLKGLTPTSRKRLTKRGLTHG